MQSNSVPASTKQSSRRAMLRSCVANSGAVVGGWLASCATRCRSDEDFEKLYAQDATDQAVQRGVDYLVNEQNSDGSISNNRNAIAMTSLAVMAMAAIGEQPDAETPRGSAMTKAVDYVLKDGHQDSFGYFGRRDGSRMYGHGITTLMLTEMLGMGGTTEQNVRIHAALTQAISLILQAQRIPKPPKLRGGWRYSPDSADSDLSVSVWQLMALRSAKNDGMDVPSEAIEMAVEYLRNSYTSIQLPDGGYRDATAGFSYMPGNRTGTFSMTAAGLLAMQVCGQYDSPLVTGASKWLLQRPPQTNERFFFYGMYYYAQGMHQAGGVYAESADELVQSRLLKSQLHDGSWLGKSSDERNIGHVYSTSLAVLSLSVRYHYLPIYQR